MAMYRRISALKARQNLGQVMNEVALRGDEYIIERAGKPLVAIIPVEKYQSMQEELEGFFESLGEMRANVKKEDSNVMDSLINEAVKSYRKGKARKRC
jgi:prevent-host-death family protein